jgi:hypothetical protein
MERGGKAVALWEGTTASEGQSWQGGARLTLGPLNARLRRQFRVGFDDAETRIGNWARHLMRVSGLYEKAKLVVCAGARREMAVALPQKRPPPRADRMVKRPTDPKRVEMLPAAAYRSSGERKRPRSAARFNASGRARRRRMRHRDFQQLSCGSQPSEPVRILGPQISIVARDAKRIGVIPRKKHSKSSSAQGLKIDAKVSGNERCRFL